MAPGTPGEAREPALAAQLRRMAAAAPLVVAHRGNSSEYPENTIPAFRSAVELGADLVELDFRETADGVLVCLHDRTLDRTTDSRRVLGRENVPIAELTFERLGTLDAGGWRGDAHRGVSVPTLEAALDVIQSGSIAMIEHKAGRAAALVALLRRLDLVEEVLVQSFDWDWLEEVHELEPGLALAALGSRRLTDERLEQIARTGASMIHWNADTLSLQSLTKLRAANYLSCVYTVDGDFHLVGCVAVGLDAITTDVPGRLIELLDTGAARRAR